MAAATNISLTGGQPQVTISGGNLLRYTCRFFLVKPPGQKWPGTTSRTKKIHHVTFNKNSAATDTFSLGDPASLRDLFLLWVIDIIVPGGGGPLEYSLKVEIKQDGAHVLSPPWRKTGNVTGTDSVDNDTELKVS